MPLLDPCGLAVDSGGAIYVFECRTGSASLYFPNGDFLRRITTAFRMIRANPPAGVAVDGDGHIYVAESHPPRLARFTSLGRQMTAIPVADPKASSALTNVSSLAGGSDGNIYAADSSQHRLARFSIDAELLNSWQWPSASTAAAADDLAFVGASDKYAVLLEGPRSAPVLHVWTLGGQEKFAGRLPGAQIEGAAISAMAVSRSSEIFILDSAASRVFCYEINL
jgi:hypothetical protein